MLLHGWIEHHKSEWMSISYIFPIFGTISTQSFKIDYRSENICLQCFKRRLSLFKPIFHYWNTLKIWCNCKNQNKTFDWFLEIYPDRELMLHFIKISNKWWFATICTYLYRVATFNQIQLSVNYFKVFQYMKYKYRILS